jgi:hypothetical protein
VNSAHCGVQRSERVRLCAGQSGFMSYAHHLSAFAAALCGVSGRSRTPRFVVFRDNAHALTSEMPCIQRRHFRRGNCTYHCGPRLREAREETEDDRCKSAALMSSARFLPQQNHPTIRL